MPLSLLWTLIQPFVRRSWKVLAIVAAALALVAAARIHDRRLVAQGRDQQRAEDARARAIVAQWLVAADSTNRVLTDSLAKAARDFSRDSTVVTRWLTRTDTIETWRHDTITVDGVPSFPVPVATVDSLDHAKASCREVLLDCSAFKRFAIQKFHTDSQSIGELRAHPVVIEVTPFRAKAKYTAIGAGIGASLLWLGQHLASHRH